MKTTKKNPRLVVPGDKIIYNEGLPPEVVRDVMFVLRMANGVDHVVMSDSMVTVAPDETKVPSEEALLDAVRRSAALEEAQRLQQEQAAEEGRQQAREEAERSKAAELQGGE